jgi:hypothetical protein
MQMPSFKRKTALQEVNAEIARLGRRQAQVEQEASAARAEYESAMAARLQILTQSETDEPTIKKKAQRRVDEARGALEGLAIALDQIKSTKSWRTRRADLRLSNISSTAAK